MKIHLRKAIRDEKKRICDFTFIRVVEGVSSAGLTDDEDKIYYRDVFDKVSSYSAKDYGLHIIDEGKSWNHIYFGADLDPHYVKRNEERQTRES